MTQLSNHQLSAHGALRRLAFSVLTLLGSSVPASATLEVGATKDVEIRSTWASCPSPFSASVTMRVGYDSDTIPATHRGLLHFDLASAGGPSSATLINARLVFYGESQTGSNFDVEVHRITETAWIENATWPKADCSLPLSWANAGGDFSSQDSVTFTTKGVGFYSVSITALAQHAIDNRSGQLHILLKGADSVVVDNWLNIRSSEYSTVAYRPVVLLTWGNVGDEVAELTPAKDLELQGTWWNCPAPMQTAATMRLGYDDAKIPGINRNLMHFDPNAGDVPASAILSEASLLFFAQMQIGSNFDVDVHRLTQTGWDETASWEEAVCSPQLLWSTLGGEYESTVGASLTTHGIGFHTVDVTDLAQDAIDNRSGQLHVLMKAIEGGPDHYIDLRSANHSESAFRPVLSLAWVTPTPTVTATSTSTITPTPLPSPTPTDTATETPTDTPTATPTPEGPIEVGPSPDLTAPPNAATPEAIDPVRQSIVRGHVRAAGGSDLSGVTVSIADHPEFGTADTRANGMFDIVVNGGGRLTVSYAKAGYIPAQRQVDVGWRTIERAADVVLLEYGSSAPLDLTQSGMQAVQGPVVEDDDGERSSDALLPGGHDGRDDLARSSQHADPRRSERLSAARQRHRVYRR